MKAYGQFQSLYSCFGEMSVGDPWLFQRTNKFSGSSVALSCERYLAVNAIPASEETSVASSK